MRWSGFSGRWWFCLQMILMASQTPHQDRWGIQNPNCDLVGPSREDGSSTHEAADDAVVWDAKHPCRSRGWEPHCCPVLYSLERFPTHRIYPPLSSIPPCWFSQIFVLSHSCQLLSSFCLLVISQEIPINFLYVFPRIPTPLLIFW